MPAAPTLARTGAFQLAHSKHTEGTAREARQRLRVRRLGGRSDAQVAPTSITDEQSLHTRGQAQKLLQAELCSLH